MSESTLNQELISELNHQRGQLGFPGITVAYVLPDGTIGKIASGFADLETKRTHDHKISDARSSIGKTFVAATVIALAKEGRP